MFGRVYYGVALLAFAYIIALIFGESPMKELVDFWKLAARLKGEARRGWVQRLHLRGAESVADHSYGVAMLSLYEGYRRGYDVGKVLKLALIHDLEEAITGDLTPLDKRRKGATEAFRLKRSAMNQVLRRFPAEGRREYRDLWVDLREGRSREARLVKDLDRLEMALQAAEYGKRVRNRTGLSEFYRSALGEMMDPALREIVRGLMAVRRG